MRLFSAVVSGIGMGVGFVLFFLTMLLSALASLLVAAWQHRWFLLALYIVVTLFGCSPGAERTHL